MERLPHPFPTGDRVSLCATRVLACVIAFQFSIATAHAAPIISASSTSANIDDIIDWVSVDVRIDDVTDLYAHQFGITFDPLVLNVFDVVEGNFLSSVGPTFFIPGAFDNVAGQITFNANTLLGPTPGATGGGLLFTILFTAVAPGVSLVTPIVDPLNGDGLLDSTLLPIEPVFTSAGTVTIEPSRSVPEPALLLLLGSGIGLLGAGRCRKPSNREMRMGIAVR